MTHTHPFSSSERLRHCFEGVAKTSGHQRGHIRLREHRLDSAQKKVGRKYYRSGPLISGRDNLPLHSDITYLLYRADLLVRAFKYLSCLGSGTPSSQSQICLFAECQVRSTSQNDAPLNFTERLKLSFNKVVERATNVADSPSLKETHQMVVCMRCDELDGQRITMTLRFVKLRTRTICKLIVPHTFLVLR